ncbi:MAG: FtsX-like permease family protein [Candidatus Eiseniibacteriota bacterium]
MTLALWIAGRYLRTRRLSGFVTVLSGISVGGVALGVTALLTVLAVMNGFENEIQTRIAGTDAHVVLLGENTAGITDPDSLTVRAARHPGVLGAAPFVYAKAMVLRRGYAEGLVVKGVDLAAEQRVTSIGRNITPPLTTIPDGASGELPGIVLGSELAPRIATAVGDTVVLASLAGAERSAIGYTPKLRQFRVVGIFTSGLYTYDSSFGFTAIGPAQELFELGDAVTGIEVRLADMFEAPRVAAELVRALDTRGLRSNNWIELNRNLFTWMKLEKAVMFVILALIVLVAAFSIVSTLFMVVLEKRRDIGVLKSLGASRPLVLRVFLLQGLLIGGIGTALGTAFGGLLIALLRRYPIVRLPGDVYFIERLPIRPEIGDFAAVILAALTLCLAAAVYPAWRAAHLDPVDAIRRQL